MIPKITPTATRRFESLVANDSRFEVKKMFGQPAAFVNGNLCVGAFGDDVFVRLGESDLSSAEKLPGSRPFEPMPGRPMRGYRILPAAVLEDPRQAAEWVERAVRFTKGLPPKAKRARR
jgi:TfoX/Sxy family transcriptional regulator of competence genes